MAYEMWMMELVRVTGTCIESCIKEGNSCSLRSLGLAIFQSLVVKLLRFMWIGLGSSTEL